MHKVDKYQFVGQVKPIITQLESAVEHGHALVNSLRRVSASKFNPPKQKENVLQLFSLVDDARDKLLEILRNI